MTFLQKIQGLLDEAQGTKGSPAPKGSSPSGSPSGAGSTQFTGNVASPSSTPSWSSSPGGSTSSYSGGGVYRGGFRRTTYGKQDETVNLINPDGTVHSSWLVEKKNVDWWECALQFYTPNAEGAIEIPISAVSEWATKEPSFNACTFTATQDYLGARWGRKLDTTDKEWLACHQYATNMGIPQEYTIPALHQLLEPYGMRVSRVRVRAGSLVLGDSVMQWAHALGCNPMALADRKTSNAEAAKLLGMTPEQADAAFRFEFHTEPLPCSVIGERGWGNTSTVKTGTFGGHARYLPPRGKAGDWFVSLQFAPADQVEYLVEPTLPEYKSRAEQTPMLGSIRRPDGQLVGIKDGGYYWTVEELAQINAPKVSADAAAFLAKQQTKQVTAGVSLPTNIPATTTVKNADGSTSTSAPAAPGTGGPETAPSTVLGAALAAAGGAVQLSPEARRELRMAELRGLLAGTDLDAAHAALAELEALEAVGKTARPAATGVTHVLSGGQITIEQDGPCMICLRSKHKGDFAYGLPVCKDCVIKAWSGFTCPTCKSQYDSVNYPDYESRNRVAGVTQWTCGDYQCAAELTIRDDNQKPVMAPLRAISQAIDDYLDRDRDTPTVQGTLDAELDALPARLGDAATMLGLGMSEYWD